MTDDDIKAHLDRLSERSIRMQARWLLPDDIGCDDDWSVKVLKKLLLKHYREYSRRRKLQ